MTTPPDRAPGMRLRMGLPADDAAIRALLRRNTMPGRLTLGHTFEPSFFAALDVEGEAARVLVAEDGDALVGVGVMAARRVYLGGVPATIGYISSLRADPAYRGTTLFARGLRQFRAWHQAAPRGAWYLGSILEENAAALTLLTSGRAGMPIAHPLARYHVLALPLPRRRAPRPPAGLRLLRGDAVGAPALAAALARLGAARDGFPVYPEGALGAPAGGALRGLTLADWWVAVAGDAVVGTFGVWDQRPFRQTVVAGMASGLRVLRALAAPLAALGGVALPRPGDTLACRVAAGVTAGDPAVFDALLAAALHGAGGRGDTCLLLGLTEGDPWLPRAQRHAHLPTVSRLYAFDWGDGAEAIAALGSRPFYAELGSL